MEGMGGAQARHLREHSSRGSTREGQEARSRRDTGARRYREPLLGDLGAPAKPHVSGYLPFPTQAAARGVSRNELCSFVYLLWAVHDTGPGKVGCDTHRNDSAEMTSQSGM